MGFDLGPQDHWSAREPLHRNHGQRVLDMFSLFCANIGKMFEFEVNAVCQKQTGVQFMRDGQRNRSSRNKEARREECASVGCNTKTGVQQ